MAFYIPLRIETIVRNSYNSKMEGGNKGVKVGKARLVVKLKIACYFKVKYQTTNNTLFELLMQRFLIFTAFFVVLAFTSGCSEDDAPQPDCPNPSYIMGLIQQVEAIEKELGVLQAQLQNAQGTDRDAINVKIKNATDRENSIAKELNNYRHCF